jgi:hypothetical protein
MFTGDGPTSTFRPTPSRWPSCACSVARRPDELRETRLTRADLDLSAISYEGISYGSVHGQAFLAYAPEIRAGCLVAGASRIAELLEYQDRTVPDGGDPFLTVSIPGYLPGATAPDIWMGLGLFSLVYDRQDPQNHASFLYRDPVEVAGTTRKPSILVLEDQRASLRTTRRAPAWLPGPIHLARRSG